MRFGASILAVLILAGCASRTETADGLARSGALAYAQVQTDSFVLASYSRIGDRDQPIDVYIEGDGLAWRSRFEPSTDPTPRKAIGLALAASDPAANVVYIARPCQYTLALSPRCGVAYWTGKRFAPEVIAAMNQAIDHFAGQAPGQKLNLVGYSGGGAVAVLVAARRADVATIRTVAGNLDHKEFSRLHEVSLMPDSLNAIDVAGTVAAIPQIHFSGGDDTVVPAVIAEHFRKAAASPCVKVLVVADATHESGWTTAWPRLLRIRPSCE